MAGDDSRMARRQVALGDVEVGAADAAGLDTDENLARPGFGFGSSIARSGSVSIGAGVYTAIAFMTSPL